MKIFTNTEKIAIETTFSRCYSELVNKKYSDARQCYDAILNYVSSKTQNTNLYNVKLSFNLTEFLPLIQYYFSQAGTVTQYKAPASPLFESNASAVYTNTFVDQAKNYTSNLSRFTRDYLTVKHMFVASDNDFVCYKTGVRYWLEN